MHKTDHHQQLTNVIENSLLHLYSTIAASHGFVPLAARNAILARWLKPKIKETGYKGVKGEIKRMLLVTKRKDGDLESKLNELYSLAVKYDQNINDAQKLFDLLNLLHEQHQIDSRLFDESKSSTKDNMIYILRDHIEHCFTDSGEQVAPVSLLIRKTENIELTDIINATRLFHAELKEHDSESNQAHIVLHPPHR
ncbi:DUF2913 family protein [Aeromonas salmonicida]|uniref:DUF2913 family protein n=1 Tax=Aeromonas salmonicida TaxID=645 RepID=UPI001788C40C|nr:DUF2913 family protein [Aeromonas salmonicida]QOI95889.1 DUF2913 family protein [Aeromonas salmonicida subsp. masoucida]